MHVAENKRATACGHESRPHPLTLRPWMVLRCGCQRVHGGTGSDVDNGVARGYRDGIPVYTRCNPCL